MDKYTNSVVSPVDFIHVYTRVSTGRQSTDTKYGLSTQLHLCDEYINKLYTRNQSVSYWKDIGSSYNNDKILQDMQRLLCKLKPKSLILISEVSRLGRSYKMVEQILKIIKKNKSFIFSIGENLVYGKTKLNDNNFIKKIMQSEKESDVLSMRIKNIQKYIRQNGGYIGKPPFGYKIEKNSKNIPVLKENPKDIELVDYIVDLTSECCSYEEIKEKLNKKQLLCNNKLWTTCKIKNILNKFYPEHMLLSINNRTQKILIIADNPDIANVNNNKSNLSLFNRIKNTKYGNLKITIHNNTRTVYCASSSSITLRSGRVIQKF
jgi:DNA invertase Pin-like site-specific DNA recombinase